MLGVKKIAVILILLGVSLPLILSLFCSGYTQSRDLMSNVQHMHLVLKKQTEPVFEKTLFDDAGIFKTIKYKYRGSQGLSLAGQDEKQMKYDLLEITFDAHEGLIMYFPSEMSKLKITDAIEYYLSLPYSVVEQRDIKTNKIKPYAVKFVGYKEVGNKWVLPYSLILAFSLIIVFLGVGILLLRNQNIAK